VTWAGISTVAALVAVGFSVWTIWTSRLRPARIRITSGTPSSFAGWLDADRTPPILKLRFAFVFANEGARLGTVTDLRLTCPPDWRVRLEGYEHLTTQWMAWDGIDAEQLDLPHTADHFPHPFAIQGGETRPLICRFSVPVSPERFEIRSSQSENGNLVLYEIVLEMRLADGEWEAALKFPLHLTSSFSNNWRGEGWKIAHWNSPAGDPPSW
jgi:hypothetical protein